MLVPAVLGIQMNTASGNPIALRRTIDLEIPSVLDRCLPTAPTFFARPRKSFAMVLVWLLAALLIIGPNIAMISVLRRHICVRTVSSEELDRASPPSSWLEHPRTGFS